MTFLLNLLWFVLGGGWAAGLLWVITGCILMLTIVGIPFGWAVSMVMLN